MPTVPVIVTVPVAGVFCCAWARSPADAVIQRAAKEASRPSSSTSERLQREVQAQETNNASTLAISSSSTGNSE